MQQYCQVTDNVLREMNPVREDGTANENSIDQ
jgi:hypothetical protein